MEQEESEAHEKGRRVLDAVVASMKMRAEAWDICSSGKQLRSIRRDLRLQINDRLELIAASITLPHMTDPTIHDVL